ncbi:MAG: type II toxin-antitoxin system VapC family toxin [Verrucomicrobiaceae bacterium]
MKWLLDTSVFSQPLKKSPNPTALERWKKVGDQSCLTSVVVTAEIEWGLLAIGSERLWSGYRQLLEDRFEVLETGAHVWKRFSEMKARQKKIGQQVGDLDLLIAATASSHGLTVATLNHRDFARIEGLAWEDWGSA